MRFTASGRGSLRWMPSRPAARISPLTRYGLPAGSGPRADIDAKIDSVYRPRVPADLPFRVEMRVGAAAKTILEFAEEERVDLIILGRQGRGAFSRWLLGNVAGKVACKAPCPVLIVPSSAVVRSP